MIAGLPAPLADGADPAAGYLATLAGLDPPQQAQPLLGAVTGDAGVPPAVAESPETRLALVRALIGTGDLERRRSPGRAAPPPADWRVAWYSGLCELAAAGRTRRGRRSAPSTTSCPASSRRSSRSASPPRRPATWPRPGTTSSSCGPSTGPTSAPASARPGLPGRRRPDHRDRRGRRRAGDLEPPRRGADRRRPAAGRRRDRAVRADLHQADQRLGGLSLDDNDPRRHQLAVEILRAALDWVSAAPPAARNGGHGRRPSASSATSRTSARCASGSSAATARSPP